MTSRLRSSASRARPVRDLRCRVIFRSFRTALRARLLDLTVCSSSVLVVKRCLDRFRSRMGWGSSRSSSIGSRSPVTTRGTNNHVRFEASPAMVPWRARSTPAVLVFIPNSFGRLSWPRRYVSSITERRAHLFPPSNLARTRPRPRVPAAGDRVAICVETSSERLTRRSTENT